MNVLVGLLPAALCAGAMYLCIRMMGGGRRAASPGESAASGAGTDDVAALRDEVARLRAQVSERDQRPVS